MDSFLPHAARALQSRAHHAFAIAVLIAARGIEIGDAHIEGARDHAGIGGDHGAEAYRGHLQSGLSQYAIANTVGPGRIRRGGQRCRGGQKASARWFKCHALSPRLISGYLTAAVARPLGGHQVFFKISAANLPASPGCQARPESERRSPGRSSPSPEAPRSEEHTSE